MLVKIEIFRYRLFWGLIKTKKFNDTIKGLTIYADEKNDNGEFENIYIKKKMIINFKLLTPKKFWIKEIKSLSSYNGHTLNSNNNQTTNFKFSKSDFGISNMKEHLVTHKKIQEQWLLFWFNVLWVYMAKKTKIY